MTQLRLFAAVFVGALFGASFALMVTDSTPERVRILPERFTAVEELIVPASENSTLYECEFNMATGDEVPQSDETTCTVIAEAAPND